MEKNPTYLRAKDIQKILPVGKDTIYKMFQLDGFPAIKLGGIYVVEETAFMKWLKDHEGKEVSLP